MAPYYGRARVTLNVLNLHNDRNDILNASDDKLVCLFAKFLVWLRNPYAEISWSERGNPVTQPMSDRQNDRQNYQQH